jgi:adenylylsulfate reductase, subunit A
MLDRFVETDVLVLGGGLSGCIAAIRAREQGARVAVVDKAAIRRSGEASWRNHFLSVFLDEAGPWDTAEVFSRWYNEVSDGLVDKKVVENLVVKNTIASVKYMEKLGAPLRDPKTGEHRRRPRPWTLSSGAEVRAVVYRGENIKPMLAAKARELGVEVFEKVHVTNLLTSGRKVTGAAGFNYRSGDFYTFSAKAVVLAMGNPERIIWQHPDNPETNPFNSYHKPWHAGTGYTLAFRAGAEIASLEFLGTFLFPRFSEAAQVLYEAGGHLINGLGETIVARPDKPGERSFGFGLQAAATREVHAGRGPLYFDCRHLSKEAFDGLGELLLDAPQLMDYLNQCKIDLHKDLLPMDALIGVWSATGSPKGVIIDEKCQTCVPGLFVTGDLATPSYASAGAWVSGYVGGMEAAKYAAGVPANVDVRAAAEAEKKRVYAPLGRKGTVKWLELENKVRQVISRYVGKVRTEVGLKTALSELKMAEGRIKELGAEDYHELLRTLEAMDILSFGQLMTTAALERKESRFGYLMGHYRADFPNKDDANWKGVATVIKRDGNAIRASRRRMS